MSNKLFSEFTPPTYEEWVEVTTASLNGKPLETLISTTPEGIEVKPLYRHADIADLPHLNGRITHPQSSWLIAQALPYPTPEQLNTALKEDLARGQTAVLFTPDIPSKLGYNPDAVLSSSIGENGTSLATAADFATALQEVAADTPIFIDGGEASLPLCALLLAQRQNLGETALLSGGIFNDPIACQLNAQCRTTPAQLYDETAVLLKWTKANAPDFTTLAVNTTIYEAGGGTAVQQLGFGLATGISHLRAMQERGFAIDEIAPQIRFLFSIGGDFFMEIAKLRAARLLWAQIVQNFGGSTEAQTIKIHAQTAVSNKSTLDPHTNLLRTTTETMAAAIAGVDTLQTAPFDARFNSPNEFSRRIARNQQLILQAEVNLTQVVDPLAGSYYVEYLTDQLANHAWTLMQEVESQGGILTSLQNGFPQAQIAEAAQQAINKLAMRKDILVGVNQFAKLGEEIKSPQKPAFAAKARRQQFSDLPQIQIGDVADMETAVSAAKSGATLGQLTTALREKDHPSTIEPIQPIFLAEPFERLRANAERYAARQGHPPRIFLANMGPLRQHKARADFAQSFFEVGGFEVVYSEGFADVNTAVSTINESGETAVCICSTDDTYPDLVPPLVQGIKAHNPNAVVILAGYPKDQIAAHKAAGIDDFIHLGANCYQINKHLQEKLFK